MRRNLSLAVLCSLVLVVGCQLFDSGPTTRADGTVEPGKRGVITQIAEGATAAGGVGVPFAGLAGTALGIIGGIGAWFSNKKRKHTLKSTVELIERLKPKVAEMTGSEDLKNLIVNVTGNTKYGEALKKAHAALKKV